MTRRTPAQYNWSKLQFDETILTKHYTSPRRMRIAFVVVHHMTIVGKGTGSALDACYRTWQTREASAHYGVDGKLVRQYVWDSDAAWATADATGNHAGISIEHANSTAGPAWLVGEDTRKTGARLAAQLHVVYQLGRPVSGKTLRKHSSFTSTACPGPFLGGTAWGAYVREAQRVYDDLVKPTTKPKPVPKVTPVTGVKYQNVKGGDNDGKRTIAKRGPKIAAELADGHPHVIGIIEVPNDTLPGIKRTPLEVMDAAFADQGYNRISYGSSAAVYARPNVRHVGHQNQILKTQFKGRKEAALHTAYQVPGERIRTLTLHHADVYATDAHRIKGVAEVRVGSAKFAKKVGAWQRHRVLAMDHNTTSGAVVRHLKLKGWRIAVSTRRDAIAYRPLNLLAKAWSAASTLSDHPVLFARFGRKA